MTHELLIPGVQGSLTFIQRTNHGQDRVIMAADLLATDLITVQ